MRTEDSAIPCRDGCPIQVIPSSSSAKNLSRKNARAVYLYILRMQEPGRFRDAVGSDRQPDRTAGVTLPVAHEKGRHPRLTPTARSGCPSEPTASPKRPENRKNTRPK